MFGFILAYAGLFGTSGNDTITGGDAGDLIVGFDGDDTLRGREGNDVILGLGGDDPLLLGGPGEDLLFGGAGNDGWISGGYGRDLVHGGAGEDRVWGDQQSDLLSGGAGNDVLGGGGDADILIGGPGDDTLRGGPGADMFVFDGADGAQTDTISDFSGAEDRVNVLIGGNPIADNGAPGILDDISALVTVVDEGPGGDVVITCGTDAVLIVEGAGTGEVETVGDLFEDPATQILSDPTLFDL